MTAPDKLHQAARKAIVRRIPWIIPPRIRQRKANIKKSQTGILIMNVSVIETNLILFSLYFFCPIMLDKNSNV